jgi:glycosyltransferase involved in cell wall biosynthesis
MSSKKTPRVSIIIRAFNEEKHIGRLLEAIQRQTLDDLEIILVDSGSTDQTRTIASRFPVKIIQIRPEDFTFGRSLNLGIRVARSELLVLASAHVFPMNNDWLQHLLAPFEDKNVALTYGMQRGGTESKYSENRHFHRWFPEQSNWDQPHAYCNNANSALRRSLWEQNPYDETLTGLEDLAWASWAKEQGYKIAYVAEAAVTHLHDESSRQIINRHRREAIALKSILPNSRFTLWHFGGLTLRGIASDLAAALGERRILREAAGIFNFRILQYLGTYRGYREASDLSSADRQVFYYPPGSLEPRPKLNSKAPKESARNSG